jgi:hypothetical protein
MLAPSLARRDDSQALSWVEVVYSFVVQAHPFPPTKRKYREDRTGIVLIDYVYRHF